MACGVDKRNTTSSPLNDRREARMATTIAVAAQMLLLAAGLAEIYAMGNVAAGGVLLLASLFALGFAFGFKIGGE